MDAFARNKALRRMDIRCLKLSMTTSGFLTSRRGVALVSLLLVLWPLLFCEWLVYPLVIWRCRWPDGHVSHASDLGLERGHDQVVMAMIISDTHLLGPRKGHWFDKLRREWQMRRSFQTAVHSLEPEVIFVTGDLFDEGQYTHRHDQMDVFTTRFHDLFALPPGVQLHAAVGNHDIGFHYQLNTDANAQFEDAFGQGGVRMVVVKGMPFVLVNSMAMEGDGCSVCADAEKRLRDINRTLACAQDPTGDDKACGTRALKDYVRPVLLQHFPLFRDSDAHCPLADDGPSTLDREVVFRPGWECLSEEATKQLITMLKPRAAFSGHIHFACETNHSLKDGLPIQLVSSSSPKHSAGKTTEDQKTSPDLGHDTSFFTEYNLPSFNWRNLNNPAFLLVRFTPDSHQVAKCYLPRETTVFGVYAFAAMLLFVFGLWLCCGMVRGGDGRAPSAYKRS